LDLYEIKPKNIAGETAANVDLQIYQFAFALSGVTVQAGPAHGKGTSGTAETPWGILTWDSPKAGVILYKYPTDDRDPEKDHGLGTDGLGIVGTGAAVLTAQTISAEAMILLWIS